MNAENNEVCHPGKMFMFVVILMSEICAVTVNSDCLTWTLQNNTLILSFRTRALSQKINFLDFNNVNYGKCTTTNEGATSCTSRHGSHMLQNTTTNETVLIINDVTPTYVDGIWSCVHRNKTFRTEVSLIEGTSKSTDINLRGNIEETNNSYQLTFECFSCWRPLSDAVEFLINHESKDNVRYVNGKCYHRNGMCNVSVCSCSKDFYSFIWRTNIMKNNYKDSFYSCEMRFRDIFDFSSFKINTTLALTDFEFIHNGTTTTGISNINHRPPLSSEYTTTKIPLNTSEDTVTTSFITGVSSVSLIVFVAFCCLFYRFWSNRKKNRKTQQDTDRRMSMGTFRGN